MEELRVEELGLLIMRLERLSVDSYWTHQASGVRGSLLRFQERVERGEAGGEQDRALLDRLLSLGFDLLHKAAREIPEPRSYT